MKLLHELRRRQMFRLVGLYIVSAWLVIQVADIAFPAWGIPDSAMRFLFYAALLCFPIALIFGWIFDVRRDGIYRTRKAGPDEIVDVRMRWQDYVILAVLAGISISILLGSVERIRTEPGAIPAEQVMAIERHENSVAVLPFDNVDPNPDTGYFSDGVADEILSRLVNIGNLYVPGRASSFAFRQSEEPEAQIASKLGVEYLLGGTVRRDGDLVRITARLVDEQGSNVWSQSFDRKLEQIFAIQSEIADAVAQRVAEEFAPAFKPSAARSTESIEAYSDFLLGKQFFIDRPPHWREKAVALFRNAIALDPGYAPPHAYLSITLGLFGLPEDGKEEIETAALTALELDPSLAESHVAIGNLHYYRDQDMEAAIAAFRRAIEIDPTLYIAYNKLGFALTEAGRHNEAVQVRRLGLERDPLNPVLMVNVAWSYADTGEFERGEQLMLRMMDLPQVPSFAYRHLADLYRQLGRIDESINWRKKEARNFFDHYSDSGPRVGVRAFANLAFDYLILGMVAEADYWFEQALQIEIDTLERAFWRSDFCSLRNDMSCLEQEIQVLEKTLASEDKSHWAWPWLGALQIYFGNADKGTQNLQKWFDIDSIDEWLPQNLNETEGFNYLVLGFQMTGKTDLADLLLDNVVPRIEASIMSEGWETAPILMNRAITRWLLGEREGAVESARQAIDAGWIDLYTSRHDPLLKDLLELRELQDDFARVELEIHRQRVMVEAADAAGDFRKEVADGLAKLKQLSTEP